MATTIFRVVLTQELEVAKRVHHLIGGFGTKESVLCVGRGVGWKYFWTDDYPILKPPPSP